MSELVGRAVVAALKWQQGVAALRKEQLLQIAYIE